MPVTFSAIAIAQSSRCHISTHTPICRRVLRSIYLVATSFILLCAGCAHHKSKTPTQPTFNETFTTHINRLGKKTFSYQLTINEINNTHSNRAKGGHRGDGPPGGKGNPGGPPDEDTNDKGHHNAPKDGQKLSQEKLLELLDIGLNKVLNDSGFCRYSYSVNQRQTLERAAIVHGTCGEKATAQDRQKFPNPNNHNTIIEEDLGHH